MPGFSRNGNQPRKKPLPPHGSAIFIPERQDVIGSGGPAFEFVQSGAAEGQCARGKEGRMCEIRFEALTLAALLDDPLTRLVMRSDGVTDEDFAGLWERVRDSVSVANPRQGEPALA